MNDVAGQMLRRIIAKNGRDVGGDARRCENLLNDLCGSYRREINVLVNAVEERVPLDLLASSRTVPRELLLTGLEKRLENQTGLTAEAARWAVETWALALGSATDAEIEERRRKKAVSAQSSSETKTIRPTDSAAETTNVNQPDSALLPQKQRTLPPPPPVKLPPRVNTQPQFKQPPAPQTNKTGGMPIPSSPIQAPARNQPINNPPVQTANPPVPKKRSFGIFRGCLIAFILLAVASAALLFGVPYAIEVMRQTQRERNSEPPRFPGG